MFAQLLVNGVMLALAFALIGVGVAVQYKAQRFFNFVQGAAFAIGAYGALWAQHILNVPLPIAGIVGVVLAGIVGVGIDALVFSAFRRLECASTIQMVASIGVYLVLQNLLSLVAGDDIRNLRDWPLRAALQWRGLWVSDTQLFVAAGSSLLAGSAALLLKSTGLGRALRAMGSGPSLARCAGIPVERMVLWGTLIGSALAGAAGFLLALDSGVTPTIGFNALIIGVVVCVVGGIGSIRGAVAGGALVGMAMSLGVWRISTQWQQAIAYVLMIAVLVFRPFGVFGRAPARDG